MTADIEALIDELASSHPLGGIDPEREQLRELLAADRDGPLHFVNLLSFREAATYPDHHELADTGLSGEQAYRRYGEVALAHVTRRGGRLVTFNVVEQAVIGRPEHPWHQVATMEYPSTSAFVDMIRDPEYAAALVHRDAGLEATLVLATRPLL